MLIRVDQEIYTLTYKNQTNKYKLHIIVKSINS